MDSALKTEICQWLAKANSDLISAKKLVTGVSPCLDTAVFHCQQAAEKALKAYLTFVNSPFQKTHDLDLLVRQCKKHDDTFCQLEDAADILTPYAIVFRYPGEDPEPTKQEAQVAVNLAKRIVRFVIDKMPKVIRANAPNV